MMKKADADFWLSKEIMAKPPEEAKFVFTVAQDGAAPYLAAGQMIAAAHMPFPGLGRIARPTLALATTGCRQPSKT
jgi:hypothetical protein